MRWWTMDLNINILNIFREKVDELIRIADMLSPDDMVFAKEYFNSSLKKIQKRLDPPEHTSIDKSTVSTEEYYMKVNNEDTTSMSAVSSDIGQTCTHHNSTLPSSLDNACNFLNIKDNQLKQEITFDKLYELESCVNNKDETKTSAFEGSSVLASVSTEHDSNLTVMGDSGVINYADIARSRTQVVDVMPLTKATNIQTEVPTEYLIKQQGILHSVHDGPSVLQGSVHVSQGCADINMGECGPQDTTTLTVNTMSEISSHIQLDSRNITVLKEEASNGEFVVLDVQLENGKEQTNKVVSHLTEDQLEKDCLPSEQVPHVEILKSTNITPSTPQMDAAISMMNLRDKTKSSIVKTTKKAGRPKNEDIPKPEINSQGKPVYVCETCKTPVKTYHALIVHMRTHTGSRPYSCNICNKSFTTKGNLKAHSVTHSDDKPWKCEYCSKTFKEKKVLTTHERIHTGEKPFCCGMCGKAFNQRSTLLEHILLHSNSRPHLCDICGQGFRGSSSLKAHKKRHLGMKEFKCNTCNKAFICRNELKRHTQTHTGDRPYSCPLCPKTFTRASYLKEHKNIHSGIKPYKCLECSEAFSESIALSRHKRKHQSKPGIEHVNVDNHQTMTLEFMDGKSDVNGLAEPENYYTATVSEETVLNDGETLIQVLSDESSKVEYFQKLRSLLISASNNDTFSNVDTSKQLYQVLCVNPDTQEIVTEGQGHSVIVEGHSQGHQVIVEGHNEDMVASSILSNNNIQQFTI